MLPKRQDRNLPIRAGSASAIRARSSHDCVRPPIATHLSKSFISTSVFRLAARMGCLVNLVSYRNLKSPSSNAHLDPDQTVQSVPGQLESLLKGSCSCRKLFTLVRWQLRHIDGLHGMQNAVHVKLKTKKRFQTFSIML